MKETYAVTGMTCSACAIHIQKSVAKVEGVSEVTVNLMDNSMTVQWKDDKRPVAETVIKAVRSAGYGATVADSLSNLQSTTKTSVVFADELRSMKQRLIVSLVAGLLVVYLAMGHMFGWPLPAIFHEQQHAMLFALTQFILSIP
ncbi:MAG: cation transporter, partial [Sphaerochaetaceae bacterium]